MSFRVMSSTEPAQMDGMTFAPFTRYVLPAGPAQTLGGALKAKNALHSMSIWNSYHRPFAGQELNGKRLAIYRHAAYGDQLMVTGIAAYIAHRWPKAQIDVYCAPNVIDLWGGLAVRAIKAPLTFDAARAYDFHLFYDQMLEENREWDQGCAYDDLFAFAGLTDVPPFWKRPHAIVLKEDFAELSNFSLPGPIAVVQLQATNPNRTYPPAQLARFCHLFLAKHRDWSIALVGLDQPTGILLQFENAWEEELSLAHLHGRHRAEFAVRIWKLVGVLQRFRSLVPLVSRAGLVICPDSSIGHLAAAFPAVPVISLWGIFSPDDRVKYYENHRALYFPNACPHAPCRNHEFKLPQEKCREAINATPGEQVWCNALRAITPEAILAKAREILKPNEERK